MAIEASKFTEKDELIAKFYTLRAGLSVIAEETEKIKEAEKNFKQAKEDYQCQIDQKKSIISSRESVIGSKKYQIEQLKNEKTRNASEKQSPIGRFFLWFFIAFFVAGALFMGVDNPGGWIISFTLIGGFIPAALAVKNNRKIEDESRVQNKKINALTQEILNDTQVLNDLTTELELLEQKNQATQIEFVQNLFVTESRLKNKVIPQSTAIAQSTRAAMLQTSKGVLNESDWQNIDLLIFYLETGRADSLKEALQLVDKQRQTDQITRAIGEASRHIANVLQAGFNRLASLMNNGFSELGRQIQFNHSETINTMLTSFANLESSISTGNRATQEQLKDLNKTMKMEGDRIAKAEQLNASLLRKANESSDNLMNELRYNQKYWKK